MNTQPNFSHILHSIQSDPFSKGEHLKYTHDMDPHNIELLIECLATEGIPLKTGQRFSIDQLKVRELKPWIANTQPKLKKAPTTWQDTVKALKPICSTDELLHFPLGGGSPSSLPFPVAGSGPGLPYLRPPFVRLRGCKGLRSGLIFPDARVGSKDEGYAMDMFDRYDRIWKGYVDNWNESHSSFELREEAFGDWIIEGVNNVYVVTR